MKKKISKKDYEEFKQSVDKMMEYHFKKMSESIETYIWLYFSGDPEKIDQYLKDEYEPATG